MFGAVIDIAVGRNNALRTFKVHEGVLRFYSGFFRTTLATNTNDGAIELPGEDPAVFDIFSLRLYTRRFANPVGEDDVTRLHLNRLLRLWIFAEAHQIPLLQNEVLSFLHKKLATEARITTNVIQYLYEHTSPTSPLRRYYMEAVARKGKAASHLAPDQVGSWPRAALIDVMRITWVTGGGACTNVKFRAWDLCQYHVHEEGVKCKKDDGANNRIHKLECAYGEREMFRQ